LRLERSIVQEQMDLIHSFARSLSYYRTIHQDYHRITDGKEFWCQTMNNALLRAVTDWCSVFGVNSNSTHWKKVSNQDQNTAEAEIRNLILVKTQLSAAEWNTYWEKMCEFRNSYVSHREPDVRQPVPDMSYALTDACAYFEWLKEQLRPAQNEPKTLKEFYVDFQIEVLTVMRSYLPKGT